MTIDVSEAIDGDTSINLTVSRTAPGSYVDGLYVEPSPSTFTTDITVLSPTPAEVQMLPSGERLKDIKKFIAKVELFTDNDRNNQLADVIVYRGFNYKLVKASDYQSYGYTRAFGARL